MKWVLAPLVGELRICPCSSIETEWHGHYCPLEGKPKLAFADLDPIQVAGYEAHSQNTSRSENPYLTDAMKWDLGWTQREKIKRAHHSEDEQIDSFLKFVESVIL
jgi:hypothetical protein